MGWYGFLNRISSSILKNRTIDSWEVLVMPRLLCFTHLNIQIGWRIGFRRFAVTGRPWWLPAVATGRFMGRGGRHCISGERMWKIYTWLYMNNDIQKSMAKTMTSLCMLVTIYGGGLTQTEQWWMGPTRNTRSKHTFINTPSKHTFILLIWPGRQWIVIVLPASPFKSAWKLSQEHKYKCVPRSFSYKSLAGGAAWNR